MKFPLKFICSLYTYHIPGTAVGARDTAVNKVSALWYLPRGGDKNHLLGSHVDSIMKIKTNKGTESDGQQGLGQVLFYAVWPGKVTVRRRYLSTNLQEVKRASHLDIWHKSIS